MVHCAYIFLVVYAITNLSSSFPVPTFNQMRSSRQFPLLFNAVSTAFQPQILRDVASLKQRVLSLQSQLIPLQVTFTYLQGIVNNLSIPRCPAQATGAVLIGSVCYSYETNAALFTDARLRCFAKGGKLAEPSLTDNSFYSRIKASLPAVTGAASTGIFIGVSSNSVPNYIFDSTGEVISTTNSRWKTGVTITPLAGNFATLQTVSGTDWVLSPVDAATVIKTYPYLCQYPTS